MAELVLPAPLSEGDITSVVEAAPSLDLATEMVMLHIQTLIIAMVAQSISIHCLPQK